MSERDIIENGLQQLDPERPSREKKYIEFALEVYKAAVNIEDHDAMGEMALIAGLILIASKESFSAEVPEELGNVFANYSQPAYTRLLECTAKVDLEQLELVETFSAAAGLNGMDELAKKINEVTLSDDMILLI